MLAGANRQIHVVQHHPIAARHVHMGQFQKLFVYYQPLPRSGSAPLILPSALVC